MRAGLVAVLGVLVFTGTAEAKPCQHKCKTSRVVPGRGAIQWKAPQTFARDDQVWVTVYVNGHDVPGKVAGQNVTTYTRGLRTVSIITRATRIEVRAANFAASGARVTVKFKQIR